MYISRLNFLFLAFLCFSSVNLLSMEIEEIEKSSSSEVIGDLPVGFAETEPAEESCCPEIIVNLEAEADPNQSNKSEGSDRQKLSESDTLAFIKISHDLFKDTSAAPRLKMLLVRSTAFLRHSNSSLGAITNSCNSNDECVAVYAAIRSALTGEDNSKFASFKSLQKLILSALEYYPDLQQNELKQIIKKNPTVAKFINALLMNQSINTNTSSPYRFNGTKKENLPPQPPQPPQINRINLLIANATIEELRSTQETINKRLTDTLSEKIKLQREISSLKKHRNRLVVALIVMAIVSFSAIIPLSITH